VIPAEPSPWLSSVSAIAKALGLIEPKERSEAFFTTVASFPRLGEACIVSFIIMQRGEEFSRAWMNEVLKQNHAFGKHGEEWAVPGGGAWARPSGTLTKAITDVELKTAAATDYATALERFGAVAKAPSSSTVTKYISNLMRGRNLTVPRRSCDSPTTKPVARAPFVFVQAARLLKKHAGLLQEAMGAEPKRETREAARRAESSSPFGWCPTAELDEAARKLEALKRNHEVRWRRACHAT
jgi:hypothetical protein